MELVLNLRERQLGQETTDLFYAMHAVHATPCICLHPHMYLCVKTHICVHYFPKNQYNAMFLLKLLLCNMDSWGDSWPANVVQIVLQDSLQWSICLLF